MINRLKELLIRKYIYPVGSIYVCKQDETPSTLFGGTWKCIADYTWERIA